MDQSEELRRRLEARQGGAPYVPPPEFQQKPEPAPVPMPMPANNPKAAALLKKRRLEAAELEPSLAQPVVVVDVRIKFWSMMVLLVKLTLAAIPAMFISTIIVMLGAFVVGLFRGLAH